MKSVKIVVLILAVCLSSAGLAVAQDDAGSGCPTEDACELWEEFKAKYGPNWTVKWHDDRDSPRALYGLYDMGRGTLKTEDDAEQVALRFISSNSKLFKLSTSDLKVKRVMRDTKIGIFNVEYQQYYQDVPVYHGEVGITLSDNSEIASVGNNFHPDINISAEPEIMKEEAVEIVTDVTGGATVGTDKVDLFILPPEDVEDGGLTYHLVWRTWSVKELAYYYVDALNGEVLRIEPTAAGYGGGGALDGGAGDSKRASPIKPVITVALLLLAVLALWRRWK